MTVGTLNGMKMPLKCFLKSGDCQWYWKRTLANIPKQGSYIEEEVTASFATPGKSQLIKKKGVVTAADDSDSPRRTKTSVLAPTSTKFPTKQVQRCREFGA